MFSDFSAEIVIEDIPNVFFFSQESWEREKNNPANFTLSLVFQIFLQNVTFLGKKKYDTFGPFYLFAYAQDRGGLCVSE